MSKNFWITDEVHSTDIGDRPINEDTVFTRIYDSDKELFCIADGLGAHGGGDLASKAAVAAVDGEFEKCVKLNKKTLLKIIDCANDAVNKIQTEETQMKTTFSGIFRQGKKAFLCNVGDTRIYSFKNKEICSISVDHSLAFKKYKHGEIGFEDIRNCLDRHTLLSALGIEQINYCGVKLIKDIRKYDAFLICSDGFWENVTEKEMESTLKASFDAGSWNRKMLDIIEHSDKRVKDNYSAVCIMRLQK